jgi:type I restriction enzyme R subunit
MKHTSEALFPTAIESVLLVEGCTRVDGKGFDRERAIFPDEALAFIRTTQGKVWEKLKTLQGVETWRAGAGIP